MVDSNFIWEHNYTTKIDIRSTFKSMDWIPMDIDGYSLEDDSILKWADMPDTGCTTSAPWCNYYSRFMISLPRHHHEFNPWALCQTSLEPMSHLAIITKALFSRILQIQCTQTDYCRLNLDIINLCTH